MVDTDLREQKAQRQLTSSDVVAVRVFGMITRSTGLPLVVGDELTAVSGVDCATVVNVGDDTDAARATAVALATDDSADLAGISGGSSIAWLSGNVVTVSGGLTTLCWLSGVTLGTDWTVGSV